MTDSYGPRYVVRERMQMFFVFDRESGEDVDRIYYWRDDAEAACRRLARRDTERVPHD